MKHSDSLNKKTLVLGASKKPSRFSFLAVERLINKGYEVVPVGLRTGNIHGIEILTGQPAIDNVHTITLYIRPELQLHLYDYILSLKPSRIIFNPGTENDELRDLAQQNNIQTDYACTLVLLSMGAY